MTYRDKNGTFIYRAWRRDKNGNIIYASQYNKKAFKIYID